MPAIVIANGRRPRAVELAHRAVATGADDVIVTNSAAEGREAATRAVAAGYTTVVASGGDGTIRQIAGVLPDGVGLGILPAGRANVAAFNLGLLSLSPAQQCERALRGVIRRHCLGWLRCDGGAPEPFLALAGLGHDAAALASVRGKGWWRYYWAGVKRLAEPRFPVSIATPTASWEGLAWSVFISRFGKVPPGIRLVPDSPRLTVAVVSPRHVGQWPAVASGRLTSRPSASEYAYRPCSTAIIEVPQGAVVHADGCALPVARRVEAWVSDRGVAIRA